MCSVKHVPTILQKNNYVYKQFYKKYKQFFKKKKQFYKNLKILIKK